MNVVIDPRLSRSVLIAIAIQAGLFLFAVCGMPQHWFMRACGIASLGFWLGVTIIAFRRPQAPTKGDLWFVQKGLLPVGLLGMFAALHYWSIVNGL